MSASIILYDIPGKHPKYKAWSPNTWRIRYALAFKGLAFKTEYIEYPDIESFCKKVGAKPTGTRKDGTPLYTLPVIQDPNTNKIVEDSLKIADYLDTTYPDTPPLFPENTRVLQNGFIEATSAARMQLYILIVLAAHNNLNPASAEYFRRTREDLYNKKLEDFVPAGDEGEKRWKEAEEGFDKIASWYSASENSGPFVMGNVISFVDIDLAARLMWAKVVLGENSEGWRRITKWSGGRWERLLDSMEKYADLS